LAARPAIVIVHRRVLAADRSIGERLEAAYGEQHLSAAAAAASGFVDEVIDPRQTQPRLARALDWLEVR